MILISGMWCPNYSSVTDLPNLIHDLGNLGRTRPRADHGQFHAFQAFHPQRNELSNARTPMIEPSLPPDVSLTPPTTGVRAILWAQAVKFVLRLGGAMILARLLTPDNYGLHGMASVIYGLLYMARDFGIVTAMQQPDATAARTAKLKQLGIFGGLALTGLGVLLGFPASWFYHEPRLPAVLATMSLGFIFGGWNAPTIGLLYREHRLALIASCDVAALGLSVVAAILAAWQGLGVWALVLMVLVYEIAMALACRWMSPPSPAKAEKHEAMRWSEIFGFSANLTAYNVANYFIRTGDQVVTGWSAGTSQLGIYTRGAQIASLPMQLTIAPFSGWAVARLARLRDSPTAYADHFRSTLNGLLHISLAIGAVCFAAPDLVVSVFFGPRWMASVPVLHWLALGLAAQPILFAPGWLLESTGQVKRLMRLSSLGTLVVVGACVVAAPRGIEAVALAASVATAVYGLLGLIVCCDVTAVTARDMTAAIVRPLWVHLGWASLLVLGRQLAGDTTNLTGWLLVAGGAVLYYGSLLLVCASLRREIFGHFLLRR